jgi:hypothetical protein
VTTCIYQPIFRGYGNQDTWEHDQAGTGRCKTALLRRVPTSTTPRQAYDLTSRTPSMTSSTRTPLTRGYHSGSGSCRIPNFLTLPQMTTTIGASRHGSTR